MRLQSLLFLAIVSPSHLHTRHALQGYHSGIIRNCTSKGVDHAVLMVAAGEEGGVPYFTIKNSWSAKWGEHGYVRIEQGQQWWGKISTVYTE